VRVFAVVALRQCARLAAILVAAGTCVFFAVRAVPGDPVALRLKNPDPVLVAQERARLGLDRPLLAQWWLHQRSFVSGDWGRSLTTGRPVREDFAEFFPATLELALAGLALGVLVGVFTAIGAEVLHGAWARRFSALLGTLGLTVPVFWIGLLLLLGGSLLLGWFPSGGRYDLAALPPPTRTGLLTVDALLAGDLAACGTALRHLALPALCLSLYPAAQVCAVLLARLQDPKLRTLITSLRARGLHPARIALRHIAPVVSAPVITAIGSNFGALLGGAVLTETVFSWPGLGRYLVDAVINRDLYAVQNVLLFVLMLVVVVVLVTDLLARLVNPAGLGRAADGKEGG
jgi:ABC-type dipeptide/oligopeptide/nickel transport system permease component